MKELQVEKLVKRYPGREQVVAVDRVDVEVQAAVHTDASTAIGIVCRSYFGMLRDFNDQVAAGNMALHNVHGFLNPADLVTKHLAQAAVKAFRRARHVDRVRLR